MDQKIFQTKTAIPNCFYLFWISLIVFLPRRFLWHWQIISWFSAISCIFQASWVATKQSLVYSTLCISTHETLSMLYPWRIGKALISVNNLNNYYTCSMPWGYVGAFSPGLTFSFFVYVLCDCSYYYKREIVTTNKLWANYTSTEIKKSISVSSRHVLHADWSERVCDGEPRGWQPLTQLRDRRRSSCKHQRNLPSPPM